jgi:hypothetical protein
MLAEVSNYRNFRWDILAPPRAPQVLLLKNWAVTGSVNA